MKSKFAKLVLSISIFICGINYFTQHQEVVNPVAQIEEHQHNYSQPKRKAYPEDATNPGYTNPVDYLQKNYSSYSNWDYVCGNTTVTTTGIIPIEMQDINTFPFDDIDVALKKLNLPSSYGGCGPIAMMGMVEYFARLYGFADTTNEVVRRDIAEYILKYTKHMK